MLIRRWYKFVIIFIHSYGTEFKVTLLVLNVLFPCDHDIDDNVCSFNGCGIGYRLGKCKLWNYIDCSNVDLLASSRWELW